MQGKPTLPQVIKSVLSALFGVQSNRDRERDFTHGSPWMFAVVGIVLVAVFVLTLSVVVHWVLQSAKAPASPAATPERLLHD